MANRALLTLSTLTLLTATSLAADLEPAAQQPPPVPPGSTEGYRVLAPGVMLTVDPARVHDEEYSRHDVVELLGVDPKFDWAKDIKFDHPIWDLEFSFKTMRFVDIDVPQANGKMRRKTIWYMVYKVKNLTPEPVRFIPRFLLVSRDVDKKYPDRVIPLAAAEIQKREDVRRELANTVQIAGDIPPSPEGEDNSVWGVATWESIDPRTDRFTVYVSGLSNSYRWQDTPEGRKFVYKTLEINFWRPSDDEHEHEGEIRIGGPGEVDYRWVYR